MPKYLRSHIKPLRAELMHPGRPWTARDRREFPTMGPGRGRHSEGWSTQTTPADRARPEMARRLLGNESCRRGGQETRDRLGMGHQDRGNSSGSWLLELGVLVGLMFRGGWGVTVTRCRRQTLFLQWR